MATVENALALMEVVASWKRFKATHDYRNLRIQCCDNSRALFDKLNIMEAMFDQLKKDKEEKLQ